jgi:hypothetical protein
MLLFRVAAMHPHVVNGLERIKFEGSCGPKDGLLEHGYNIHLVVVGEHGGEDEEEMDVRVCSHHCCCLRLGCGAISLWVRMTRTGCPMVAAARRAVPISISWMVFRVLFRFQVFLIQIASTVMGWKLLNPKVLFRCRSNFFATSPFRLQLHNITQI